MTCRKLKKVVTDFHPPRAKAAAGSRVEGVRDIASTEHEQKPVAEHDEKLDAG